jgi:hypothetical protein
MKSVNLLCFICLLSIPAFAQVRFGAEAGININSVKYELPPGLPFSLKSKSTVGPRLGIVADVPLSNNFSFQPGIFYSARGGKQTSSIPFNGITISFEGNFKINYIEVPLFLMFKADAGPGKLMVGAGPGINMGLNAKLVTTVSALGYSEDSTSTLDFGSDTSEIKRFDFSANFCAGYEFNNGFFVRAGYNLGLVNLSNNEGEVLKNRAFVFTLGYFLKPGTEKK